MVLEVYVYIKIESSQKEEAERRQQQQQKKRRGQMEKEHRNPNYGKPSEYLKI